MKFPKTLGECIDLAYRLRQERLEVEEKVKSLKGVEEALKTHLVENFQKSKIDGARGEIASASVTPTMFPSLVEGSDEFFKYVIRNPKKPEWELLERRASRMACKERREAGVVLPGITWFDGVSLSLTKLKGKVK